MGKLLTESVTETDAGTWDFHCPVNDGSCGTPGGASFSSTGWPTKKDALARGEQHFNDHRSTLPDADDYEMPELVDFQVAQGISQPPGTVTTAKEL